jgi:hypothetical protein
VSGDAWVFDGPPYRVERPVYSAAQVIVWLDFPRRTVLWRATRRAWRRTWSGRERGGLRHWFGPQSPWFAWSVYAERRREFAALDDHVESRGKVLRLRAPASATPGSCPGPERTGPTAEGAAFSRGR